MVGRSATTRKVLNSKDSDLVNDKKLIISAFKEGADICSFLMTLFSVLLILLTLPCSLAASVKVVQEYERAVIFRLGRIKAGGAKGPGLRIVIPCIDSFRLSILTWPRQQPHYEPHCVGRSTSELEHLTFLPRRFSPGTPSLLGNIYF